MLLASSASGSTDGTGVVAGGATDGGERDTP